MEGAVGGLSMFADDENSDTADEEPNSDYDNNVLFRCSVSEFTEAMGQLREVHSNCSQVAKKANEVRRIMLHGYSVYTGPRQVRLLPTTRPCI
jgi:hypothetical protein